MNLKKLTQQLITLISLGLLACGSVSEHKLPEGHLLPAEPVKLTSEQQRLKEMQYLRVVSGDPDDDRTETWDLEAEGAEALLLYHLRGNLVEDCGASGDPCTVHPCNIRNALASADRLLLVARGLTTSAPSPIHDFFSRNDQDHPIVVSEEVFLEHDMVVFPSQSSATKALLARMAGKVYRDVISYARFGLQEALEFEPENDGFCDLDGVEGGAVGVLAQTVSIAMREAIIGLREASDESGKLAIAVADQQLGSSTQASISAARTLAGEELSRAAAAHDLVGGKEGIWGNTSRALCSASEMSHQTHRAIEVVRDLAPPPLHILAVAETLEGTGDANALDDFLNGTGQNLGMPGVADYSLLERFAHFHPYINLNDSIEGYFGLQTNDFALAVKYLADELNAFSRALRVRVDGFELASEFVKYGATATPPADSRDAYWVAVMRTASELAGTAVPPDKILEYEEDPQWIEAGTSALLTDLPEAHADAVSWATLWAAQAMTAANASGFDTASLAPLQTILVGGDSLGFFEHYNGNYDRFRVSLFEATNANSGSTPQGGDYYLAVGDDAMRCAVHGTLEGQTCDPYNTAEHLVDVLNPVPRITTTLQRMVQDETTSVQGISSIIRSPSESEAGLPPTGAGLSAVQAGSRRVYLLKVNASWVPSAAQDQPFAGDFEVLTGMAAERKNPYGGANTWIRSVGIVPRAEKRAAQFMKLSRDECSRTELTCVPASGTSLMGRFDERLPLEDELAEDGDGVESSWKYYLAQARETANTSDRLAQEYVASTLAVDVREEGEIRREAELKLAQEAKAAQELQVLQSICGTSIDVAPLLDALTTPYLPQTACSADELLPGNIKCIGGFRVNDWSLFSSGSTEPELKKLQRCINDFAAVEPLTQMSTSNLCYWGSVDDDTVCSPNARPSGSGVPERCPAPLSLTGATTCPAGMSPISTEQSLNLYSFSQNSPPPVPAEVCKIVRDTRRGMTPGTAFDMSDWKLALQMRGIFDPSVLKRLRGLMKVEAKFGGFVDISLGGSPWISTGSISESNLGQWPCLGSGAIPDPALPDDCVLEGGPNGGLFCQSYNCGNSGTRAQLNDRLLNAALAFQIMSQPFPSLNAEELTPHVEFWLPVYLAKSLIPLEYAKRDFPTPYGMLDERSNTMWKVYSENDPFGEFGFVRNGIEMNLTGVHPNYGLPYNLAFRRSRDGVVAAAETIPAFFSFTDDVFEQLSKERGSYLQHRLDGVPHAVALDWASAQIDAAEFLDQGVAGGFSQNIPDALSWPHSFPSFQSNSERESFFTSNLCLQFGQFSDGNWFEEALADAVGWISGKGHTTFTERQEELDEILAPLELSYDLYDRVESTEGHIRSLCNPIGGLIPNGANLDLAQNEEAVLDVFELVCEAEKKQSEQFDCATPPDVRTAADLSKLAFYLECEVEKIGHNMAGTLFPRIPSAVLTQLTEQGGVPAVHGEMGQELSKLRDAMREVGASGEEFARIFSGFAIELRQTKSRIQIENLEDELAELNYSSTVSANVAQCVTAVSEASGYAKNLATFGTHWVGVAATCGNSVNQSNIAAKVVEVSAKLNDLQRSIILGDAESEFLLLSRAVSNEALALAAHVEQMQRSLGAIEELRDKAWRSIDHALWHLSYQDEKLEIIDNVMSAQAITAQERY